MKVLYTSPECENLRKEKDLTLSKLKAYQKVADLKLEKLLALYEIKKQNLYKILQKNE